MRILISLIMALIVVSPVWSADEWLKTRPAITDQRHSYSADQQANNAAVDRLLANYREGMTLSYSSATTISVSSGEITCSNSDGSVRKMRQNTSATNVTFSDIDTGSEAPSTTYYIYANCDADATTATFKISASSTAPTGITSFKRLGSFYNDASSNITIGGVANDNNVFSQSIGSYSAKSANVTYQAATDGFVIATDQYVSGSEVWSSFYIYTDSSSSPTTLVGGAAALYGANWINSVTAPVKKGDYWKTVTSSNGGSWTYTVYWVPTGN